MDSVVLELPGLQSLIDVLRARGYTVIGPTVRDGAIVNTEITSLDELPRGWGDEQDAGHYRLRQRGDHALFGFAAAAQSAKPIFFPSSALVWRGRRTEDGFSIESARDAAEGESPTAYALVGVRSCDLHAIAIHDTVLAGRIASDDDYQRRRTGAFIVAVTCSDPGGTCFCASMGTGPRPDSGYDLRLTELMGQGAHRFLVESGSALGAAVLGELPGAPAGAQDLAAAARVAEQASHRMGRELATEGLHDMLHSSVSSPQWQHVADRCLACANCTLVCPTCFCTSVEDTTDLPGETAERRRVWDSCFSADFSYLHGGAVRRSTASRYRQWMTHKLASWVDQFGMSGCVGCGRCITWCPAAIDITAEAAALWAEQPAQPEKSAEA